MKTARILGQTENLISVSEIVSTKMLDMGQGNKGRWKTAIRGKRERRERKHKSRNGISEQR